MSNPIGDHDVAADFLRLNEYLLIGGGREQALQRLVDLAVESLPGCDWAAVTQWPQNKQPRSLAYSAEVALTADQIQYALREGPCLTAAADADLAYIADMAGDGRWPQFRAAVRRRTPIRALLSFPIHREPDRAAVNLYSKKPNAFDPASTAAAALFATHATVLLMHAERAEQAANLSRALASSRQIGTAIGILMSLHKITADDALALLKTTSQQLNRKVSLIADEVNSTGTLPDSNP